MNRDLEQRLEAHRRFWRREDHGKPLCAAYVAPDFFFSTHYEAVRHLLLEPGKTITPDMLEVQAFLPDYERMYQQSLELEQDAFWVGTPFTGIPWMEAILGCPVTATPSSFVSHPTGSTIADQADIELDPENPWLAKYLEFTEELVKLSAGRFPVGQPIMRGPSDMLGSMLGQEALVYAMMQQPEKSARLLRQVAKVFRSVMQRQEALIEDFHGGRSIGFYHIWTPGKCIWYQEDLSALLSPTLFKRMLKPAGQDICTGYDHTLIHLHPASFFIVDELLEVDEIKVIQINKDVGGPSVAEMMPVFKKVMSRKRLAIWGDLDETDLELIKGELAPTGIFLFIVAEDVKRLNQLLALT